jgi:hypothetical protein
VYLQNVRSCYISLSPLYTISFDPVVVMVEYNTYNNLFAGLIGLGLSACNRVLFVSFKGYVNNHDIFVKVLKSTEQIS